MRRIGDILLLSSMGAISLLALVYREPVLGAAIARGQNAVADGAAGQESAHDTAKSCSTRSLLVNFQDSRRSDGPIREVPIWNLPDTSAFFFSAGMTIDADGSPNAYSPDNTGLDDLVNAGAPGHWDGVIQDEKGDPIIQGPEDPFPGFFVSCTSLVDRSKKRSDPTRYVDASKIPYVVLPGGLARDTGARLGDFAVVVNVREHKIAYAQCLKLYAEAAKTLEPWAKARWHWQTISASGRTPGRAAEGLDSSTSFFPDQATDSRERWKKSTRKRKKCFATGEAPSNSRPARRSRNP